MGPRFGEDMGFAAWAACCGPGFRWFGPRGRPRRRRVFERGDLKYVILGLLEEQPMHGYEVMQRLEEESGGYYTASPGSVYPVLQMLEDLGHVEVEDREGKKVYSITESGRAFLEEHRERADRVYDRLSDIGEMFTGSEMRDVTKSFIHLAQISFEKAMRAAGDAASMEELKEILDRAAKDLEGWSSRHRPAS